VRRQVRRYVVPRRACFDWVSMFRDDFVPVLREGARCWYWEDFSKVEAQNGARGGEAHADGRRSSSTARSTTACPTSRGAVTMPLSEESTARFAFTSPDENHWDPQAAELTLWYREFSPAYARRGSGTRQTEAVAGGAGWVARLATLQTIEKVTLIAKCGAVSAAMR